MHANKQDIIQFFDRLAPQWNAEMIRSDAVIDHHHEGTASKVSRGLMHEDDLEAIFAKYLDVTVKISNDHMF